MLKRGDKYLVKKGSVIRTTHPIHKRTAGRDYQVILHSYYPAYLKPVDEHYRPASVHWVGTGGYWCWINLPFEE